MTDIFAAASTGFSRGTQNVAERNHCSMLLYLICCVIQSMGALDKCSPPRFPFHLYKKCIPFCLHFLCLHPRLQAPSGIEFC